MKKFLVTILSIIYLATSSGATMHRHYCMGKVYSVDMVKSDVCEKCGMKAKNGCCKDERKVVKGQDNHQFNGNEISVASPFAVINRSYNIYEPFLPGSTFSSAIHNNSPPPSSGSFICILKCVFRL